MIEGTMVGGTAGIVIKDETVCRKYYINENI